MILRLSKISLLLAVALFFSLVAFTNMTDYGSNAQFVRHVLSMDTTFPGNRAMWRALPQPWVHTVFYLGIICWETATAVLCWAGGLLLLRQLRAPAVEFARAKSVGIAALTLGLLLWFVAFLTVGASGS